MENNIIDVSNMTLKQMIGYKGMKLKDFTNRATVSNILNGGVNVGKFNKEYLGDKEYYPSHKTVKNIADTLGVTVEQAHTLIKNQLK